jgi:hypothetical protein
VSKSKPTSELTELGPIVGNCRKALLPFRWSEREAAWIALPQRVFRPTGLMIWDAPLTASVRAAVIGADLQLVAAFGDIPALWFAFGDSYSQIAEKMAGGLEPPAWGDWDAVNLGSHVRIDLVQDDGKPVKEARLIMWGLVLV